jgi:hypothetical protein
MSAVREAPSRPALRVVRGDATPEEIAAVVAVLARRSRGPTGAGGGGATRRSSAWADRSHGLRTPLAHHAGAWRASARPR